MDPEDREELKSRIRRIEEYADEHTEEHDAHGPRCVDEDIETAFRRSLNVAPLTGSEPELERPHMSVPLRTPDASSPQMTSTYGTIPTLPMDVVLEIASHLHPLTLLQYSRTSKSLRAFVLSPKSRRLWRAALQSVPGLPSCPEDMNEPAYVALVFDRYCMACGADGAYYADYALRVRFCEPCFERNVKPGTAVFPKDVPRVVREAALMLLPTEDRTHYFQLAWMTKRTPGLDPCKHALDDRYYQPEVDALIKWLWPVPPTKSEGWDKLEGLLQERFKTAVRRRAQSVLLQAWERCLLIREDERERAVRSYRKIVKRLSQENLVNGITFDVNDILSSIVQGSTLKDLDQMSQEQTLRSQRRYQPMDIHLQARYAELAGYWDYLLDNHFDNYDRGSVLPNRHDGARLLDFAIHDENHQGDIDDSMDSDDSNSDGDRLDPEVRDPRRFPVNSQRLWDGIDDGLLEDMRDYVSTVQSELSKLMPQPVERNRRGHKKRGYSMQSLPENMLKRAGALFRCCQCGAGPEPYPLIHAHWRQEHPDESIYASPDGSPGMPSLNIKLCQGSYDLAPRILDAVGLRRDTKWDQLDELLYSGHLYCSCGDPFMDPPEDLFWSDFVWHVFVHLNMFRNRRLHKKSGISDESLVYINDHADLKSCLKLLPPTATRISRALYRVCPDPYTRARVNARLAACPEGAQPVCRICAAITADEYRAQDITMPKLADAIVYHMQAKHGRRFSEKDLMFDDSKDLERPSQLAEKDVHLELEHPGRI